MPVSAENYANRRRHRAPQANLANDPSTVPPKIEEVKEEEKKPDKDEDNEEDVQTKELCDDITSDYDVSLKLLQKHIRDASWDTISSDLHHRPGKNQCFDKSDLYCIKHCLVVFRDRFGNKEHEYFIKWQDEKIIEVLNAICQEWSFVRPKPGWNPPPPVRSVKIYLGVLCEDAGQPRLIPEAREAQRRCDLPAWPQHDPARKKGAPFFLKMCYADCEGGYDTTQCMLTDGNHKFLPKEVCKKSSDRIIIIKALPILEAKDAEIIEHVLKFNTKEIVFVAQRELYTKHSGGSSHQIAVDINKKMHKKFPYDEFTNWEGMTKRHLPPANACKTARLRTFLRRAYGRLSGLRAFVQVLNATFPDDDNEDDRISNEAKDIKDDQFTNEADGNMKRKKEECKDEDEEKKIKICKIAEDEIKLDLKVEGSLPSNS